MCLTCKKWFMPKEFPKWVPYAGFPRRGAFLGQGQGLGLRAPPRRHAASEHTLHQPPLFKQKTSWPVTHGRFQRWLCPGEIAPAASPISGEPLSPSEGPDPFIANYLAAGQGHEHRPRTLGIREMGDAKEGVAARHTHSTVGTTKSQRAGTAHPRPQIQGAPGRS